MQVILIRHGQTAGNAALRYIGRTDEPLSEEGVALAKQIGADSEVRRVYVTPLRRTQQTAAILFPAAQQIVVDDLQEIHFGDFEGRSYTEMEHDIAYRAWVDDGCLTPCPNGESRAGFSARVCAAFEAVVRQGAEQGEKTLTFVVHGGTIMAVMEQFARPKQEFYSYSVKNGQGYRCRVEIIDDLILTDSALWREHIENPI